MVTKHFSTGLPALDAHAGGIAPGSSLLLVVSDLLPAVDLLAPAVRHARAEQIAVAYLAADGSLRGLLEGTKHAAWSAPAGGAKGADALLGSVKRFLGAQRDGTLLLTDDLAAWAVLLKQDKHVAELVAILDRSAERKRSFALVTARRSGLPLRLVGGLKDTVTAAVDVVLQDQDLYVLPLANRGTYVPRGAAPCRIPAHHLRRSAAPTDAPADPALLAARPAELLGSAFAGASEALMILSAKGDEREVNRQAEQLSGCTRDELRTLPLSAFVPGHERFRFARFLVELRSKRRRTLRIDLVRKNGRTFPAELSAAALGEGMFLCIVRDDSERRMAEEAARRSGDEARAFVEHSGLAILIAAKGKLLAAGGAAQTLFGLPAGAPAAGVPVKQLFRPESAQLISRAPSDATTTLELDAIGADGQALALRAVVAQVRYQGKDAVQISCLDVSRERALERSIASALSRYRAAVESSGLPVALLSAETVRAMNPAFGALFGLDESAAGAELPVASLFAEEDALRLQEAFHRPSPTKKGPLQLELRGRTKEGALIDVRVTLHPVAKEGIVLLFAENRSVQKEQERAIVQQQRDLALLKEIISSSTGTLDLGKLLKIGLDKILDVLHWEMGAVYLLDPTRKEFQLHLHHHFPEALATGLASLPLDAGLGGFAAKTQEPLLLRMDRYPSYLPHRSLFRDQNIARVCLLPLIARDEPVGLLITAAKKEMGIDDHSVDLLVALSRQLGNALANALAYQQVKRDEEQYQRMVESSPDVMYTALPNGSFLFISPQVTLLTGYTPKDFYRNPTLWLSLVHADDKKVVLARTTRLEESGEAIVSEYRLIPKGKAAPKWVRDELSLRRDASGAVSAITGIVTDVTRSREIVDHLDAKTRRDSAIFSSITEGVMVLGRTLQVSAWNRALEAITGQKESDVVGRPAQELAFLAGVGELLPRLNSVLAGELVVVDEIRFVPAARTTETVVSARFAPLKEPDGAVSGIVGVILETTARVDAAENSRATEQVLTNVLDTMDDILIITDLKGTIIQVNKSFLRVLGYTRGEAIGLEFPYAWLIEEEMGRFVLWIANLRERNWLHDFDMTWRAKDGRLIPMSLSTTLLRNSLGEPIAMLNIARDITERTRLARDLETRSKQVEMINRIISKANQTVDFDEIFSSITEEIEKFLPADAVSIGLVAEDGRSLQVYALGGGDSVKKGDVIPIEQTVSQFAIRSQKPAVVDDLLLNPQYSSLLPLSLGLRSQISLPIVLKGKPFGTLNIGCKEPHTYTAEHAAILQPLAQQIGAVIDRIQLVKRVTDDSFYIRNLLDSIDSIVYTVDARYRILEVNKAFRDFLRESGTAPVAEYLGVPLFGLLPSEPLKIVFQNVVDQLLNGSVRIFSQEFAMTYGGMERIFQITINPMVIGGRITGLVFTHTDITALKITELELKQSNEQLLALNEISTVISTSFDLQDILRSAVPLLKDMLGASAVVVYLIEHPSGDLYLAEQIGLDVVKSPSVMRLRHGSSATGSVIETKEPLFIATAASADPRITAANRAVLREGRIDAMAAIPLVAKDRVLGALDIFYGEPHDFLPQEQQMLALVGNQLGSAIENAQLYSELRSQIDRLTVLYDLSQRLTSTLDIDQIFRLVYESVAQALPFERFLLELYDAQSGTTTPMFLVETRGGERAFIPQAAGAHPVDPGGPETVVVEQRRPFQTFDKRSMYVPMLSKEQLIGIMSTRCAPGELYAETHLRLLESIGNLAAIALEKGKLYEETLQKSREIQQRNKELDDFTYVVSHDLKEPLISIEGFSRILQMDYQETIQQEGKEYLESIVGATTRMKGLIDDLLMLSRVSRPSESFRSVDIRAIIEEIKTDMEFTIRQKGVRLEVQEDLPQVPGNATQLQMVFRNLIGNAIKFNKKPNPVVEIGFHNAENNAYLFHIRDNGIGIDPDFHEKIFVIFQRLHRREEYEGSGAGLAIVKKIIEIHKGRIWVESVVGEGSTFYFTIPKTAESPTSP
jgi:PAS domain S-box-containing protein